MASPSGFNQPRHTNDGTPAAARLHALGWWLPERLLPVNDPALLRMVMADLTVAVIVVLTYQGLAVAQGGHGSHEPGGDGQPVAGYLPATSLADLGDRTFIRDHRIQYPCVSGAMANGIASVEIVEAMSRAGMLGFFGSAGLSLDRIDEAISRLQRSLGSQPHGFNLIHSPNESDHEFATADLYIRRGVRLIEASAYLRLTPAVVRFRLHGIHEDEQGRVVTPNRVIAKVSRIEVATRFFSPAPEKIVQELVQAGHLTAAQAELAKRVPVAQDITAEADSGGHTDNRPAITLLPTLLAARDRLQREFGYPEPLRVGLGGGIATPQGVAAAFAMGAAYVVTGSINQACVESGSSDIVRGMLAEAEQADVAMAPAADMFEMGVKVQVQKRGTMFAMRANKLYELYRAYPSLEALPDSERQSLEKNLLRASIEQIWAETSDFFRKRDPRQLVRAAAEPKHRMALVFRWYLGMASRWANAGIADRKVDYQVWCGPAMGAFNEWVKGTAFEKVENRKVASVNYSLLHGAAILNRQMLLRQQGIDMPVEAFDLAPVEPGYVTRAQRESG